VINLTGLARDIMTHKTSTYWDINVLNKVYREGYMSGVMGRDTRACPYECDIRTASWNAGREDAVQANQVEIVKGK